MSLANRIEHDYVPNTAKHVFFRRSTPREPVELVIGRGRGDSECIELTPEQFANLVKAGVQMYFSAVGA